MKTEISALALALAMTLTACGGGSDSSGVGEESTSTGEGAAAEEESQPQTAAAAKKVAQEETERFTSGDYAGAYDLWTENGKKAISRNDYVKLSETCATAGIPLEVSNVRLEGKTKAIARIGLEGFQQSYELQYEQDQWRWQPLRDDIVDYKKGVEGAIAARKAEGGCQQ